MAACRSGVRTRSALAPVRLVHVRGREEDDGDGGQLGVGADGVAEEEPVHPRHQDVGEDGIGHRSSGHGQRLFPAARQLHRETRVSQSQRGQLEVQPLVVHDQDPAARALGAVESRDQRPHDLQQPRRLDGLGQERRVLEGLSPQLLDLGDHPGDDEHRSLGRGRRPAKALDDLQAVHVGQDVVLEDEVRRLLRGQGEGGPAVPGLGDAEAVALQGEAHHLPRDRVVLDHEDERSAHAALGPSGSARWRAMSAGSVRVSMGFAT